MRRLLAGSAALVLSVGLGTTAGAVPATAPAAPVVASPDPVGVGLLPAQSAAGTPVELTLLTGDRVVYTDSGGVRPDVSIDISPDSGTRSARMEVTPDGVFVVPDVAAPLVESGLLDERLFDVKYLAENGYGDDRIDTIPLIVTYADGGALEQRSAGLPATDDVTPLPSIDGAGVDVAKDGTSDFWQRLAAPRARSSAAIEKVWLDARVTVNLDDSRTQIGVPDAWESGYDGTGVTVAVLDTGYDTGHPDLAGQVAGSRSFIAGETVQDGHGHGTHVASTVAGTGEASNGRYAGVAPGARLLVGKVLSDSGSSFGSEVIDGMEWAVEEGADVVNMSLGSFVSNGKDPQSEALNALSAESGTLFVVAAGNYGPSAPSVTSPATADAALAVAAVDVDDVVADFSSRGPRLQDGALKPEISAPGAAIVAARASGTEGGVPVGEHYTASGGTSMASPHVAGVAAMVAQLHPDWTGEQIKDALMSTSVDLGQDLYAQGTGRVDAAAVTSSPLTATGKADLGTHPFPRDGAEPRSVPVTYTNSGSADLEVALALDLTGPGGAAPPQGALALSAETVMVPAGGTATVDLTLDPAAVEEGRFTGHLRATAAGGVEAITAVAFEALPETHELVVNLTGRDGGDPRSANVVVVDEHDPDRFYDSHGASDSGRVVFEVPAGDYSVYGDLATRDPGGQWPNLAGDVFFEPGVHVAGDAAVDIDAREAVDYDFRVADDRRPTEPTQITPNLYRTHGDGTTSAFVTLQDRAESTTTYGAIPSPRPEVGDFRLTTVTTLREPLVRATIGRSPVDTIVPRYTGRFDGRLTAPLVDVGAGTEADYEAADVEDAVVLVEGDPSWMGEQAQRATAYGAAALIVMRDRPGAVQVSVGSDNELTVLGTSAEEGARLRERLADGPVSITLSGVAESGYTYQLWVEDPHRIPDELVHTARRSELATIVNSYHSDMEGLRGSEIMEVYDEWEGGSFRFFDQLVQPVRRHDYVTAGPQMRQRQQVHSVWGFDSANLRGAVQAYEPGRTYRVAWHEAPSAPTSNTQLPCAMCRTENIPVFTLWMRGDSDAEHYGSGRSWGTISLFRDGKQVSDPAAFLVERRASYRVDLVGEANVGPEHQLAAHSRTSWTFESEAPTELEIDGCREVLPSANACAALPVIMLGYDVPLDLRNRAQAGRPFEFTVRTSRPKGHTGPTEVAGMKVSISYDDGATWRAADVERGHRGTFTVSTRHPKLGATNGFASLRVEAWDRSGSRTVQTIERAYFLH